MLNPASPRLLSTRSLGGGVVFGANQSALLSAFEVGMQNAGVMREQSMSCHNNIRKGVDIASGVLVSAIVPYEKKKWRGRESCCSIVFSFSLAQHQIITNIDFSTNYSIQRRDNTAKERLLKIGKKCRKWIETTILEWLCPIHADDSLSSMSGN